MCLHARDLPCEGIIIGRAAAPVAALIDLDDTASQEHHAQLFLHVLAHDGVRRGISAVILDYHLEGDDG